MAGWQLMVAAALVLAIAALLILVLATRRTAHAVWGIGGVLAVLLGVVAATAIKDAKVRAEAVAVAAPAATIGAATDPSTQPATTTGAQEHQGTAAAAEPPTKEPASDTGRAEDAAGTADAAAQTAAATEPAPVADPTPVADLADAAAPEPPAVPSLPSADPEERAKMLWEHREEARAVATDPERCRDAREVADAWAKIRQITKDDEIYRRAYILTKWLERCRARIQRNKLLQLTYDRVLARRDFDKTLQERLRDSGRSPVWVRVTGPTDARLWITGGGFDTASEKEILDGGLRKELTDLGFLRVTFVHGTERNVYHFDPEREADIVHRELERLGLAAPLEL